MPEFVVEVPGLLKNESARIEKEVAELISGEEKRKLLSLFMDEVMKGGKQLSDDELVRLGRDAKKGRSAKLMHSGLV